MDYVTFRNKEDAACKMQRLKTIGFIREEDSGNPYFQNGIGRLSLQTDQGMYVSQELITIKLYSQLIAHAAKSIKAGKTILIPAVITMMPEQKISPAP